MISETGSNLGGIIALFHGNVEAIRSFCSSPGNQTWPRLPVPTENSNPHIMVVAARAMAGRPGSGDGRDLRTETRRLTRFLLVVPLPQGRRCLLFFYGFLYESDDLALFGYVVEL
jgi:hypothetical protein